MSHTIAVRTSSKKAKQRMLSFLEEHYRDWRALTQTEGSFGGSSHPTDGVDHDKYHDTTIGFNYKSWLDGWELEYIHAVLNWVACKVGHRVFAGQGECPYIIYEGEVVFPVTGSGPSAELAIEALEKSPYSQRTPRSTLDGHRIILQELRRLDVLWS